MPRKSDLTSAAALLGRKGGQATAQKLTPEQRRANAKKAIAARWSKRQEPERPRD